MHFLELENLPGVFIIEPDVFEDVRGYFFESFNQKQFEDHVGSVEFVQDNQSRSRYGVLRGLHYQKDPFAQAKLVRVVAGKALDVVVDLRQGSPTYGKHAAVELSAENKRQLFVPRGFAHGFISLSEGTEFFYKVDNYWSPEHESGVMYNDPDLGIDWGLPVADIIVNAKDGALPLLSGSDPGFRHEKHGGDSK